MCEVEGSGRCVVYERGLRRPCTAAFEGGRRAATFDRLLMTAIISPRRLPPALAAGFQTLPQGRLRKPSAHKYQKKVIR